MRKFKLELHWQIFIAIVLAVIFGIFLPAYVKYVDWLGELFMRALKMIVVPLVLTSMISGIANLDTKSSFGKIGFRAMLYIFFTTLIAILIGMFFVNTIQPGVNANLGLKQEISDIPITKVTIREILLDIVPSNFFAALAAGDMLPIILFSLFFGFFITKTNQKYSTILKDFFNAAFDVMMKFTQFIIKLAPFGIFGLIAKVTSQQKDLLLLAQSLGKFVLVVLIGLFIQFFIVLPVLIKIFANENPIKMYKKMIVVFLTAFSTASSAATLSVSIDTTQNKLGVSNKIAGFMLPLGATVNMNGTALYELVVAFFIAQAYGIHLTLTQQIIAVLTTLLTAVGAAGIPMASLVMISVVLTALGLPLEGIGLILAVDRILDMFRTTVNVTGDICGSVILAKLNKESLTIN